MQSVDTRQVFSLQKLTVQMSGYARASSIDLDRERGHTPKEGITHALHGRCCVPDSRLLLGQERPSLDEGLKRGGDGQAGRLEQRTWPGTLKEDFRKQAVPIPR